MIEIPFQHLDPARFRCHLCLSHVPVLFRDFPDMVRTEIVSYDPDMAAFPDGY